MRSLMLGDCAHYKSPYMRGVGQAMALLGHEHAELSIRQSATVIDERIVEWKPDIIWTHMLLWPPPGSPSVEMLQCIVMEAVRRGALVVIHDGDAKESTRYPHDISDWCALALVNHGYDRSDWGVPLLKWPYFAMAQRKMAKPVDSLRCGLFFAGTMGGGIYAQRTALLGELRARGIDLRMPKPGDNSIAETADIAASADAVLGFGRADVPGWCDTRCFQYPGAGAILLHDDAQGYLEPWEHFVPYESGSAESVITAMKQLWSLGEVERLAIRRRAFDHVQLKHSSVARVRQVLVGLDLI